MNEFAKRFNSFDYRLFSDCINEQDVNAVVEVIWPLCEEEDEA